MVEIVTGAFTGEFILLEDWWDRIAGKSWMACGGHPACLDYAMRDQVPIDDEVVYGKIGMFGKLVHASQLDAG